MRKLTCTSLAVGLWLAASPALAAEMKLNSLFSEGVVLQQGMKVPVFGTAGKGDKITVTFGKQVVAATADDKGDWRADLAPLEAGGPWPMTVAGTKTIELKSVYVGEVWLCSGQSNMVWELEKLTGGKEAAQFTSDQVRMFVNGKWVSAGPEVNPKFSGLALFFGMDLQAARKTPVGLIVRAVGATSAEQWTPLPTLKQLDIYGNGELFEQQIKPLVPFAIKGMVWYQGEWNVSRPSAYAGLMAGLITSWREAWGQGDFPVLIVQLPRSGSGPKVQWPSPKSPQPNEGWANLRAAQVAVTAAVPNAALVVSYDESDGDLHPKDKRLLAQRTALAARGLAYGEKIPCFSPLLEKVSRDGDKVVLKFRFAGDGLKLADSAGAVQDLHLLPVGGKPPKVARATVEGDSIIIDAAGETEPFDIYYAWASWPNGNLFSKADLPVSPFRYLALRPRVVACNGNTITLAFNKRLVAEAAVKAASYDISGAKITTVAMSADKTRITLTTAAPLAEGKEVVISAAGLQGESATGAVPVLKATPLPGLVCGGEPIEEILVGQQQEKVDNAKVLEQDTIDAGTKPEVGAAWRVIRSAEPFDLPKATGHKKDVLLHACVYIYSQTDQKLQLVAASNDSGIKMILNGKAVLTNVNAHGIGWGEKDKATVAVNKGWNVLLLAFTQRGGGWASELRILGPDGKAPTGVSYQADKPAGL